MKLARVTTLKRLIQLAENRKAIVFKNWGNPIPAAFVIGMPARVVARMMEIGVYEHKSVKKRERAWQRNSSSFKR